MKTFLHRKIVSLCLLLLTIARTAWGQGTTITYQGHLTDGSHPADGVYDLRFGLFDSAVGGAQLGAGVTLQATSVSDGLFNVSLDFGNQFGGASRWLEIAVRTNGASEFTTLVPRQQLTPTPYAITASHAASADNAVNATRANTAASATHADTAASATRADSAMSATHADTAASATRADTAASAAHADTAASATSATHADTAASATRADTAASAARADNATIASTSGYATSAGTAGYATGASTAGYATSALTAGYADTAGNATSASNAATLNGFSSDSFLRIINASVGINTPTPESALHVLSQSPDCEISIQGADVVDPTGPEGQPSRPGRRWTLQSSSAVAGGQISSSFQIIDRTIGVSRLLIDTGGNVGIGTTSPRFRLEVAGPSAATFFANTSDRDAKENFRPVDVKEVLDKVAALPLSQWNYKEDSSQRHLGPVAQDFYAAFKVGPDDKHITTVDESGVALAAIQGLNQKVDRLRSELDRRNAENTELKRRLDVLEEMVRSFRGK